MGRLKGAHYDYRHVNGRSRNEIVKCSEDELMAMAAELNSSRNTDKMKTYQRRRALVRNRKGGNEDGE